MGLRGSHEKSEECVVDLAGALEGECAALRLVKERLDALFQSDARTLTAAEGDAVVRAELRERRSLKRSTQ